MSQWVLMTQETDSPDDTKSLSTYIIRFASSFSLHLNQQNHTNNHGTTVWDSAKMLSYYLFNNIKHVELNHQKKCIELGSGCGLNGLIMASLGFNTTVTDLQEVVDSVLIDNCQINRSNIQDYWAYSIYNNNKSLIMNPSIHVKTLDWLVLCKKLKGDPLHSDHYQWIDSPYHYILASDCIYNIDLIHPLLESIRYLSSPQTIAYIAVERRDDIVIDGFMEQARSYGFDTRLIPKRLMRNEYAKNIDIEIWKLKLRGLLELTGKLLDVISRDYGVRPPWIKVQKVLTKNQLAPLGSSHDNMKKNIIGLYRTDFEPFAKILFS
ncbi:putative methyltransferase-domain-containing protein [Pilobolus umbonatus]|nr:putative methyltransferase-domain-containing protein [Pilobolus umbonatus]